MLIQKVADYKNSNMRNVYSQGSPDLILDFCNDFWNGSEVAKLNKSQRKKLLDLYQRFSASSYCTAFSYKPLFDTYDELVLESCQNKVLKCPANYYEKISSHYNYGHLNKYECSWSNLSGVNKRDRWDNASLNLDASSSESTVESQVI